MRRDKVHGRLIRFFIPGRVERADLWRLGQANTVGRLVDVSVSREASYRQR